MDSVVIICSALKKDILESQGLSADQRLLFGIPQVQDLPGFGFVTKLRWNPPLQPVYQNLVAWPYRGLGDPTKS